MTGESMNYKLFLHSSKKFVIFHWKGSITKEDRINNIVILKAFCKENDLKKVLVVTRDQISEDSFLNQYTFAKGHLKAIRGLNVAVILRKDDNVIRFMETVALNHANYVKGFYSLREAASWLKEQ